MVVGGPGQRFHLGAGLDQPLTRICAKVWRRTAVGLNLLVQEDLDGLPELQGGGIQVTQGPQPFLFAFVLGAPDDIGDQEIEHVQGIIHRDAFEGMRKGEQGGQPSLWGHAGNGLGPCGGAIAG